MQIPTQKVISNTKNFVAKHKTKIAVVSTAYVCLKIHTISMKQHEDFLKEKGLYDEFYTPTDEEMGE